MAKFEYNTLTHALLEALPELKPQYEEAERACLEPGWVHMVFAVVVNPYLESLLAAGGRDDELRRVFAFLEQMAEHSDPTVQDVLLQTVFGVLEENKEWRKRARQHMGEATRHLYQAFR